MTAITKKAQRKANDFYPTPAGATKTLLKLYPGISGVVWECCTGAGDITNVLKEGSDRTVITNDIDQSKDADYHVDLSTPIGWFALLQELPSPDWIVTNPPFCHAPGMVPLAYEHAQIGIAMLLRLTFLEPCDNRIDFLSHHPPTKLIVLPRISFTGDGGTDSVCTAWMIWDKRETGRDIIIITGDS